MPRRPLVDTETVAAYLGTNARHVRGLVERRAIPFTRAGRLLRFDLDKIDKWLEANATEVAS